MASRPRPCASGRLTSLADGQLCDRDTELLELGLEDAGIVRPEGDASWLAGRHVGTVTVQATGTLPATVVVSWVVVTWVVVCTVVG